MLREIPSDGFGLAYKLRDDESGQLTLLEQLFEWAEPLDRIGFSIDAKDATNVLAEEFNALVIKYKMERRVVWGSGFSSKPHELVTSKNKKVAKLYTASDVLQTYALWLCGCVFCCPLPGDFFQTTHMSRA